MKPSPVEPVPATQEAFFDGKVIAFGAGESVLECLQMLRHGASVATLRRRCRYHNRKARSAMRRLLSDDDAWAQILNYQRKRYGLAI